MIDEVPAGVEVALADFAWDYRRLVDFTDDPSELRVPGESGGPDPVRERSLSLTLPDLGPGLYRLEVEVRYRLVQTSRMVEFRVAEGG